MNIPIDILLNLILVSERVRPSMLVQSIDYGETELEAPKTKNILDNITIYFPHLYQSKNYNEFQGVIISYDNYDGQTLSEDEIGKILGYPYFNGYSSIDRTTIYYSIIVYCDINGYDIQLLENISNNKNKKIFKDFVKKAEKVLKIKVKDFIDINVGKLSIKVIKIPTVKSIINKIILNKKLRNDEINEIKIILLFNFSNFDIENDNVFGHIQFDNIIHKNILLKILEKFNNNRMIPFEKYDICEEDLINILIRTSKNYDI